MPSSLEIVLRTMPVAACVAVTSAPGIAAPLVSVTVPLMEPYPCAIAGRAVISARNIAAAHSHSGKFLNTDPAFRFASTGEPGVALPALNSSTRTLNQTSIGSPATHFARDDSTLILVSDRFGINSHLKRTRSYALGFTIVNGVSVKIPLLRRFTTKMAGGAQRRIYPQDAISSCKSLATEGSCRFVTVMPVTVPTWAKLGLLIECGIDSLRSNERR